MITRVRIGSILLFLASAIPVPAQDAPMSFQTAECLDCHEYYHPGIVADWKTSRHARITPAAALQKPHLERRVSNPDIPLDMQSSTIGCYECHSLNNEDHADSFEHFGYQISVVVSPRDCRTCHLQEADEYAGSKKAHALDNLQQNPLYHTLVETITSIKAVGDDALVHEPASYNAKSETCFACHGTHVKVLGFKEVDVGDEIVSVPDLANWPNQGVGRLNPDGSVGACTACHPRHSFSIEIARKPYTCAQCHLDPDVPAWNVYRESKHGNIFLSHQDRWNWDQVPWRVGQDFRAPTCATCHNSLVVTPDGDPLIPRTHDFGARLWVRIFGLIHTHPQPRDGRTYLIRNADDLPLPTTFSGQPAAEFLIDSDEQASRRADMQRLCRSCHSIDWIEGHFARLDSTIAETDRMTLTATSLLSGAWESGLANPTNPFDESLEHGWMRQWLFYANSVRYASAMSGPDYAAFKNGWWKMTNNLRKLHEDIAAKTALKQIPAQEAESPEPEE